MLLLYCYDFYVVFVLELLEAATACTVHVVSVLINGMHSQSNYINASSIVAILIL